MSGEYDRYNFVVGTQTIAAGSQYKFTEKTALVETAERIMAMGSKRCASPVRGYHAGVPTEQFLQFYCGSTS
jgi:hypothetical protein